MKQYFLFQVRFMNVLFFYFQFNKILASKAWVAWQLWKDGNGKKLCIMFSKTTAIISKYIIFLIYTRLQHFVICTFEILKRVLYILFKLILISLLIYVAMYTTYTSYFSVPCQLSISKNSAFYIYKPLINYKP
jgi:hypothetical protein